MTYTTKAVGKVLTLLKSTVHAFIFTVAFITVTSQESQTVQIGFTDDACRKGVQ